MSKNKRFVYLSPIELNNLSFILSNTNTPNISQLLQRLSKLDYSNKLKVVEILEK